MISSGFLFQIKSFLLNDYKEIRVEFVVESGTLYMLTIARTK